MPIEVIELGDPEIQHVDRLVEKKARLQRIGRMGTRKQDLHRADREIDRDGLSAELAACILLAPNRLSAYVELSQHCERNRGRDLPSNITGLDRPVEIKQTRYMDATRGFLLIRPPAGTVGAWKPEYLDDSYFILLCGSPHQYQLAGWADRGLLENRGVLNPVPVATGQRECWGILWSQLYPIRELFAKSNRAVAMRRGAR